MEARVRALESEMEHLTRQLSVMAELAEEGQEAAEQAGLDLMRELDRLATEVAVERTRPERLQ